MWFAMKSLIIGFLLVVVVVLKHARGQECFEVTSCLQCLSLSQCQAWTDATGGRCLESCASNAVVDCYYPDNFPNLSTDEICQLADNAVASNAELCASQMTCGDCIGTILSDGETPCRWYPEKVLCASACDTDCGESTTTCPVVVVVVVECSNDFITCDACLQSPECGAWADGSCLESCDLIADVACYTVDTFPNKTVDETCKAVADIAANDQLCSSKTDCGECVETILSDGNTTCQWFINEELCASDCDMSGCGETTCQVPTTNETVQDPCNFLSCQECLDHTILVCSWSPGGGCLSSCDTLADEQCFASETYNATDVCVEFSDPSPDEPNADPTSSAETFYMFHGMVGSFLLSFSGVVLY